MWRGYEDALKAYLNACIDEWVRRGYRNQMERMEHVPDPPDAAVAGAIPSFISRTNPTSSAKTQLTTVGLSPEYPMICPTSGPFGSRRQQGKRDRPGADSRPID